MRKVAEYLQKQGIPVWIDIEKMEGSILEMMADAIERSSVIIIGLSANYSESQNCRTEAEYAYALKKPIIFFMAEDNFKPFGWLGAMLGTKFWYQPWKDEAQWVEILNQIRKFPISAITPTKRIKTPPTPQSQQQSGIQTPPLYNSNMSLHRLGSSFSSSSSFSQSPTILSLAERRITIRKFRKPKGGISLILPASKEELLQIGGQKLGIQASSIRTTDEAILDDFQTIRDNDVLYLLTPEEEEACADQPEDNGANDNQLHHNHQKSYDNPVKEFDRTTVLQANPDALNPSMNDHEQELLIYSKGFASGLFLGLIFAVFLKKWT